ncbi:MAG: hypothetical protein H7096_06195 [Flavobacterium sp.]|nr:hypothetical protein [Pedobacter sp.]
MDESIIIESDIVESDIEDESESPFADLFELQAATDNDKATAKKPYFNKFFISYLFKVVVCI